MLRSPLTVRFSGYGLLGVLLQVPFSGPATSLWMVAVYGAGGMVLEGLDVLLRLPVAIRALGLVAAIYALGTAVGWAVVEVGADPLWQLPAAGGYVRLDLAPAWFLVAAGFRFVRHGLDRVQAMLDRTQPAEPEQASASLAFLLPHER
ncbi:MAG TPA: hypothetical protein VK454_02645 [Myxococcaceae bacterium]|nr:hypothetical protein [Myxococcaceae bacterium]